MNKFPVLVEQQVSWVQPVLVSLVFFLFALLAVGLLTLVFDTVP